MSKKKNIFVIVIGSDIRTAPDTFKNRQQLIEGLYMSYNNPLDGVVQDITNWKNFF